MIDEFSIRSINYHPYDYTVSASNPKLQTEIKIQNFNPKLQSEITVRNYSPKLQSEIKIQNYNPKLQSEITIQNLSNIMKKSGVLLIVI